MLSPQRISVVIPTYNNATYVAAAVESVLEQTARPLEVIVIDDGSTDDTPRVLGPYQHSIRYLRQPNSGVSAARNRGIAAARGDLIAFLDADDVWLPNKLALQLGSLSNHPEAVLIHSDVHYWQSGEVVNPPRGIERHKYNGMCYNQFFRRNSVILSTVLARRECLVHAGGFDEEVRRPSAQDYDLWWRLARRYALVYVEEPLVLYRLHPANASKRTLMMREDELYVVLKALRSDEQYGRALGRQTVHRRLFELMFEIGYLHFDNCDLSAARRSFLGALRCQPTSGYAWLLTLSTLLPPALVRVLRSLKQGT